MDQEAKIPLELQLVWTTVDTVYATACPSTCSPIWSWTSTHHFQLWTLLVQSFLTAATLWISRPDASSSPVPAGTDPVL